MKKLLLMALLLGLTGCGENNQSDSIKTDTQPIVSNQREALNSQASIQSSRSAIAPSLRGWTVNSTSPLGSGLIIDAEKLGVSSSALIKPTPIDVAKVLRGGAAGIALSIAVDQLLDAVDWVLDPANNQIKYKKVEPSTGSYFKIMASFSAVKCNGKDMPVFSSINEAILHLNTCYQAVGFGRPVCEPITSMLYKCIDSNRGVVTKIALYGQLIEEEKTLPLETVAEQVISNADADSLDAQVATGLAAQSILNEAYNDDAKAEPIANELENNAKRKCTKHENWMDDQAAVVRDRYTDMYRDKYNMYKEHYDESNPLILDGVNKGSWLGHVTQYRIQQIKLQGFITRAINDNCPPTSFALRWVSKDPPPKPGVDSPN